ncbi:Hypothetical predicted protein [Olea europaea subsp. europaea]|uniref:Uncharacterized protein n=1 Tax=Olea europaea subsp. europaea TaxID=158383 RepID=A0A8S0SMQ0_OLEEU|nr:Hypothetical predicted protein [Olea europaea subsp. europaea]
MSDLVLVETLPDNDVAMSETLHFIITYFFPRDYKKIVDHFLFTVNEDFSTMNWFSWDKLLFETTLGTLKDRLSMRTSYYRLRDSSIGQTHVLDDYDDNDFVDAPPRW